LPLPARPEQRRQRAGLDLDRDVVERGVVAEALDDVPCLDHRVSSFGFSAVIKSSVVTAISASTTAEAYAPTSSNDW
jgi:hypothetical protein